MTAPFDEVQFPTSLALGAAGGPQFSTTVVVLSSGYEDRNQNWAATRGTWDAATGIRTAGQMALAIAFFRARWGKARGFRFKDWSDFTAVAQTATGAVGGGNTVFQLAKAYSSGGQTYIRTIAKPVSGTISVWINGVLKGEGADYTIDYTAGTLTMSAAPAYSPIWSGQFDVPARFDTDQLDITVLDPNGNARLARLPITEIRV
jgi:uncharacterized protein (TIGR02217 family)